MGLVNKAVVTGTSGGLGWVVANTLVHYGFDVIPLSVRNGDVRSLFQQATVNRWGRIACLINNAATLGPTGSFDGASWEEWEETFAVNFMVAAQLTQLVLPNMKHNRYGKIINIVGGNAPHASSGMSAYGASKTALVQFTQSIAAEVKEYGIDVNAVAPGPMATRMYDKIKAAGLAKPSDDPQTPERAAELVCWLASSESDGLTGRYISARHDPWPWDKAAIAEIMKSNRYTLERVK